jgi:hypothetical protein
VGGYSNFNAITINHELEFQNNPAQALHEEPTFDNNDYSRNDIQLCLSQQAQLLQLFNNGDCNEFDCCVN